MIEKYYGTADSACYHDNIFQHRQPKQRSYAGMMNSVVECLGQKCTNKTQKSLIFQK